MGINLADASSYRWLVILLGPVSRRRLFALWVYAVVAVSPLFAQGDEFAAVLPGRMTMVFVWIAPGTFTMGSPAAEPDRHDDEGPLHEVRISRGFWLGKYEITQGQWSAVMGTEPWVGQALAIEHPEHPAVNISYNDFQEFIDRLNQVEGEVVYRLPTEAEWEYACRAGTRSRWSFGEDEGQLGDYAWFQGNARDIGRFYGHPVGTKRPNPWGLYDMHGNAWEMVSDGYGPYDGEAVVDPQGAGPWVDRIARGGSFGQPARNLRSAKRVHGPLDDLGAGVGARLVRLSPTPSTAVEAETWGSVKVEAR